MTAASVVSVSPPLEPQAGLLLKRSHFSTVRHTVSCVREGFLTCGPCLSIHLRCLKDVVEVCCPHPSVLDVAPATMVIRMSALHVS